MTERVVTRDFLLLVAGHFLQGIAWATTPILPVYLDALGASRTEIGLVFGVGAVGGLAMRPLVGWSLDVWGRRRTLVVGTLFVATSLFLVGFVTSMGSLIYVQSVLNRIGVGALFTGYFALAADLVPASRRTEGLALFGISGLVPLALNPFMTELGWEAIELRWLFVCLGIPALLSMVPTLLVREPARPVRTAGSAGGLRSLARVLVQPRLLPVWLATCIFSGCVASFLSFATVVAETRGLSWPAGMWLSYAAGAIAVRLFGARLPDRLGPTNLVVPSIGIYAAALVLVAGAADDVMFLLAGLLAGLGHGYSFPVLSSQVVSRVDERFRGSGLALFTALFSAMAFVLNPVLGAAADRWSDGVMFAGWSCATIGLLTVWAAMEHTVAVKTPGSSRRDETAGQT